MTPASLVFAIWTGVLAFLGTTALKADDFWI